MRKNKFATLLASTAFVGLSPVERQMGRLMRSPDEHAAAPAPSPAPSPTPAPAPAADAEPDFAAFEKAAMTEDGEVAEEGATPPAKTDGTTEEPGEDGEDDGAEEADETKENSEEKPQKKGVPAKDRIRQLNAELRAERAARETDRKGFEARLERIEKGLPAATTNDNNEAEAVAPDPTDLEKYPLGILDDRYQEDKLQYLAEQKVKEQLGSLLQREQQLDQQAESERAALALQAQAETLASKGAELFDDFDEIVVKPAMAGEFDLGQPTFEAAAEAEHGPAILHFLASDHAEAARVAKLSPYLQTKYVLEKNAEIAAANPPKPEPKKIPGAETPPADTVRGQGARQTITADTTDFAAFERLANGKK